MSNLLVFLISVILDAIAEMQKQLTVFQERTETQFQELRDMIQKPDLGAMGLPARNHTELQQVWARVASENGYIDKVVCMCSLTNGGHFEF